jgi:hypothetical protein
MPAMLYGDRFAGMAHSYTRPRIMPVSGPSVVATKGEQDTLS